MHPTTPRDGARPARVAGRSARAALTLGIAVAMTAGAVAGSEVTAGAAAVASPVNNLRVGITHTQYSADGWNDPSAVANARSLLVSAPQLQNQHIMGWGAENPEPSPGMFDFSSLDARLDLIRATGGTPVITLCCAPDWMKGGKAGATDWSAIEAAPTPEHFDDFATLARQVAARYRDVKHFQVWNELKGFWDSSRNRWNIEAYTDLYNRVYTAVKSVDPSIRVGGPYVPVDSWADASTMSHPSSLSGPWGVVDQRPLDAISYWLGHKAGADFVTVDAWTGTKDRGLTTDEFTAIDKLAAVTSWIRARTALPVWWGEYYPAPDAGWSQERQNAVLAVTLQRLITSGASAALLWQPQADGSWCQECVWTDTRWPGGGTALPSWQTVTSVLAQFPPGTRLEEVKPSDTAVRAVASPTKMLLANTASTPRTVTVSRKRVSLGAYGVVLADR